MRDDNTNIRLHHSDLLNLLQRVAKYLPHGCEERVLVERALQEGAETGRVNGPPVVMPEPVREPVRERVPVQRRARPRIGIPSDGAHTLTVAYPCRECVTPDSCNSLSNCNGGKCPLYRRFLR